MEVVVAELNSHEIEIKSPDQSGEFVPGDVRVDEVEYPHEDPFEQGGLEVWQVHGFAWVGSC